MCGLAPWHLRRGATLRPPPSCGLVSNADAVGRTLPFGTSLVSHPSLLYLMSTPQGGQYRADDLEKFLVEQGRKDAIDSIIANRHAIAHGRDSGITVARVVQYLDRCVEVIDFMEAQCK